MKMMMMCILLMLLPRGGGNAEFTSNYALTAHFFTSLFTGDVGKTTHRYTKVSYALTGIFFVMGLTTSSTDLNYL